MGQSGTVRCFFRGDPAPTHDSVEKILHRTFGAVPGLNEIVFSYDSSKGYKVLSATNHVTRSGTNASLQKYEIRVGTDIRADVMALLRENGLMVDE